MQTLLSRTRPCLRMYCKTGNPLAQPWSPFERLPTTENQRQYSNSRSKIKLRRTRVKNTPEGFALSLVGQIALADNKLSLSRALALSRSLALSLSVDTFSLSLSP